MSRFCAADIGSNSIKVRIIDTAGGVPRTLFEDRYPIRLGASTFDTGVISPSDIELTVSAFQEIAATCRSYRVQMTRAVATSATREAVNRNELVSEVARQTGIEIDVISGAEEARLLALGCRRDMVEDAHNLVIDVGGGSTEVIYTRTNLEIDTMHTLRIGAVRLQQTAKLSDPITRKEYEMMASAVDSVLEQSHLPVIARKTHVLGVAGTMRALLDIKQVRNPEAEASFSAKDLDKALRLMREMTLDQMGVKFGIDRRRAQIIIPGALIVLGIMELYGIERVNVSNSGLRDGILQELITRARLPAPPPQDQYVLRIGEKYHFDRPHAEQVARLADDLFVQTGELHKLSARERTLLHYAALLHDIGQFVSYSKHHKHSCYLIMNEEFPALTELEQQIVAVVSRYHRKSGPDEKHIEFASLPVAARAVVVKCAALLRVADALDRQHRQLVTGLETAISRDTVRLTVDAAHPVFLELSAAKKKGNVFEKVFSRSLDVVPAESVPSEPQYTEASHGQVPAST